jgi:hypothetical protein
MAKDVKTIIQETNDYLVNKCGRGNYSDYYVGITKNIQDRLFGAHAVPEKYCWIWHETNSEIDARSIEKYFLDKGMKGAGGGGDKESVYVYVYRISPVTNEDI